jgi:hypothetical protein
VREVDALAHFHALDVSAAHEDSERTLFDSEIVRCFPVIEEPFLLREIVPLRGHDSSPLLFIFTHVITVAPIAAPVSKHITPHKIVAVIMVMVASCTIY